MGDPAGPLRGQTYAASIGRCAKRANPSRGTNPYVPKGPPRPSEPTG
jgi:hypothetical protein